MSEGKSDCKTDIHIMHLIVIFIFIVQIKVLNNNQMSQTKTVCSIKINIRLMEYVSPLTNTSTTSKKRKALLINVQLD